MQYEADRLNASKNVWPEPSLAEMTDTAIRMLRKENNGYFLIVEGKLKVMVYSNIYIHSLNEPLHLAAYCFHMPNSRDTCI